MQSEYPLQDITEWAEVTLKDYMFNLGYTIVYLNTNFVLYKQLSDYELDFVISLRAESEEGFVELNSYDKNSSALSMCGNKNTCDLLYRFIKTLKDVAIVQIDETKESKIISRRVESKTVEEEILKIEFKTNVDFEDIKLLMTDPTIVYKWAKSEIKENKTLEIKEMFYFSEYDENLNFKFRLRHWNEFIRVKFENNQNLEIHCFLVPLGEIAIVRRVFIDLIVLMARNMDIDINPIN